MKSSFQQRLNAISGPLKATGECEVSHVLNFFTPAKLSHDTEVQCATGVLQKRLCSTLNKFPENDFDLVAVETLFEIHSFG